MRRRWLILLPAVPLLVVCLGGTRGCRGQPGDRAGGGGLPAGRRGRADPAAAPPRPAARAWPWRPRSPAPTWCWTSRTGRSCSSGRSWAWCLTATMPLRRAVPWLVGYVAVLVAAAAPRLVGDLGWGGLLVWSTAVAGTTAAGAVTGFALAARQRSEAAARAEAGPPGGERGAAGDGAGRARRRRAQPRRDRHAGRGRRARLDRDPARAREPLGRIARHQPGGAGRPAGRPGPAAHPDRRRRPRPRPRAGRPAGAARPDARRRAAGWTPSCRPPAGWSCRPRWAPPRTGSCRSR